MNDESGSTDAIWTSEKVGDFYSGETAGWREVLGPGMHYHFGSIDPHRPTDDAQAHFVHAVRGLYRWIPSGSRVIDVGCGWGGPARMLVEERNCSVHGITISEVQGAEFAARMPEARVSIADAQEIDLDPVRDHADVGLMLESLTHMTRPDLVLRNLRPHVGRLLIQDHIANRETGFDDPDWRMRFPTRIEMRNQIAEAGFRLLHEETKQVAWRASAQYWLDGIHRAYPLYIPKGQFQILKRLCESIVFRGHPMVDIVLFVAEPDEPSSALRRDS